MSNQTTDLFAIWKDNYRNMEKYWGKTMDDTMRTDEFSEWMGKVLESNLMYKEMLDQSSKQYLEHMNLPSREDLASLSSLIVNLDAKVDHLEEQFEDHLDSQTPTDVLKKDMDALKKEVRKIGRSLDDVLKLLKENQEKTDQSSSSKEK